ncbi:MAG TPA: N-acetyltransferase [Pyrinomonadaceae bacterium]|nr:N-acetyltransferase [Pyrinomonadaceae bacterium]
MVTIRAENLSDLPGVRRVNELAFGGSTEADLVDALRKAADPYISLVAIENERIVGHIFFSPVKIEPQETFCRAMALAPMAVLPDYQNRGIGSLLVQEGMKQCAGLGYEFIVVVGHPEYYPRFGFVPAHQMGLRCKYPVPDDVFMVVELKPGALTGKQALVLYHPEFDRV